MIVERPALERRVDEIARAVPGFFIGRFDVRYSDVERFKAGEDALPRLRTLLSGLAASL